MQLERHFVEKPWGRTDLPSAFAAPLGKRVGEVWYETPAGAPLPLLVKWLFTSEKLSIQVHPSDAAALASGKPSGKEECWYIVDAEPDAMLAIGTIRPLNSEELRAASLSGEIEQLMDWKPVKAGDYFYIPAGTVHAIGAGITLVEVQQYADITYRLYDYGRPRELHLDDGVAVSKAAPYADRRSGQAVGNMQLVDGPYFRLWMIADAAGLAVVPDNLVRWVVPLSGVGVGSCQLMSAGEALSFDGQMLVASTSF
jgi:mannose-6-phosphate isomerase